MYLTKAQFQETMVQLLTYN